MRRYANALLATWLLLFSLVSYAANQTFAEYMAVYDWPSLLLAGACGLLGGAGRTLMTQMSEQQVITKWRFILMKDLVVAMFGGTLAFLCIDGYNSWAASLTSMTMPTIDRGFRVLIIVLAGASRGRWLGVVDKLTSDALANASQKIRGGAPKEPATLPAPLSDK